jgi:regulator of sirC expression with transglutaminase-like and TPR domain
MSGHTRDLLAAVVRTEPIDLGLACLLIAAEDDPELVPASSLGTLRRLAEATYAELARSGATGGRASAPGRPAGPAAAGPPRLDRPGEPSAGPTTPPGGTPTDAREARRRPIWPTADALARHAPVGGEELRDVEPRMAAEALRTVLGEQAGFGGQAADYDDLASSLLPRVLKNRAGLPILLSVVWLEVARRSGIPAYPIALPGHFIVGVGTPGNSVLVDPFAGGRAITVHEAAEKVRASGSAFVRSHLAPAPRLEVVMRILTNIRVWATRTDAPRPRLWAVELSLLLPRHPAALRRERGELLVRLGDFLGGARELETFAEAVAPVEPTAAAAARRLAVSARARLN